MKTIYLRAGTEHVEFGGMLRLMATALSSGEPQADLRFHALLLALPKELRAAVDSGHLPVKDPLTMGPHPFPIGGALDEARVMVSDLRNYVAQRNINVTDMPEVIKQARVLCIDPVLEKLPSDAPVYFTDNIGTGNGKGTRLRPWRKRVVSAGRVQRRHGTHAQTDAR